MEFRALEVGLKLSDLNAVGVHRVLLDVARLVDLVDEDLGVAVGNEPLDSQGYGDAQSVNQGLIFVIVIRHLVVDL
jgi:hypothetical protein